MNCIAGKKRHAFTLTETAIVLSIMGLVLGAIWSATGSVSREQKITTAQSEFMTIIQGARTMLGAGTPTGFANGADLTYGLCQTGNTFPANTTPSGGCGSAGSVPSIIDPWAGLTTVVATSFLAANAEDAFEIKMTNVDQAGCIGLLSGLGGQSRDSGLHYLAVGTAYTIGASTTFPITPATASGTCGKANTVIAVFSVQG